MKINCLSKNILIAAGLSFCWGFVAGAEVPMASQYRANQDFDACRATQKLADFLVDQQKKSETCGVGWTWLVGEQTLSANMAGLVSLALLDAYQTIGKQTYLVAAQRQAHHFFRQVDRAIPFKSDIELMMRLGQWIDDLPYQTRARDLFVRIQGRSPTGAREVARIRQGRASTPALLGYDVALAIRAAVSVNEKRYAYELADALIEQMQAWYHPKSDIRYSVISAAALVPALQALDEARYSAVVNRIRSDLTRLQGQNGAWLHNETQATAHATLGLMASPLADERQAAQKGITWLISTLLQSGSLAAYNDYMPEPFVGQVYSGVNAEALRAISFACAAKKEQNH